MRIGGAVCLVAIAGCGSASRSAPSPSTPTPIEAAATSAEGKVQGTGGQGPDPVATEAPRGPTVPEVPAEWRCEATVAVQAVLEDETYRGYPDTPARSANMAAASPHELELDLAESHGASYRSCSFRVALGESTYRLTWTWDTTFEDLPETWCEEAGPFIEAQVQRTTRGCTDLHAGAWYGHDLVPVGVP